VCVVGDRGVGKTSYIKRHSSGDFVKAYTPSHSSEQHVLKFPTNYGLVSFIVIDVANNNLELPASYLLGKDTIDGALMMFSYTDKSSYGNLNYWYNGILKEIGKVPIVMCANKVDIRDRQIRPKQINFHKK
jgi:GTP-binding nuclear protein Ran